MITGPIADTIKRIWESLTGTKPKQPEDVEPLDVENPPPEAGP